MNKRDRHHQRFVEYLKFFQGRLVTTWPVLTEVTHHVPVSKAVEIIALVRDGALEVIDLGNAGARCNPVSELAPDDTQPALCPFLGFFFPGQDHDPSEIIA